MQFQQAKEFILDKLSKELPENLTYHTLAHVLDVCNAAENIGILERITKYEMKLLLTAALFHDAGFINDSKLHEEESCKMAGRYLPGFGYTTDEIESVKGIIMATKIPQSPKNHLEEIICDADLDYLGRNDFFGISDTLYTEFTDAGIVDNENDWNKLQVKFFEGHHYFTKSAIKLRQGVKVANLKIIKSKIID
jgi:uncharacterized protein